MLGHVKNVALFLIIGLVLQLISKWLQSDFLNDFLDENLITLLLALLAINLTTISVIMTKLKEMTEKNPLDFSRTIRSMRESIGEQVVLLSIAAIVSILKASALITAAWSNGVLVFDILLTGILAASIYTLYDTSNGIFVILQYESNETSKRA